MEDFIVSARKYRPMTFDSVVGQRGLTATLKNAVNSGKLAHAYLFCGPRGVGKTTCARIFAKAINCTNPSSEGDACGECDSCRAFNEQRSMNIHELDAASNNSVDDIREIITQVQIPPQTGRYKVFIIDEVHMLSATAFNAFLKTLEEPPSYVIFILATTERHKILPTILSRCQVYDFVRMSNADIISHLTHVAEKEGYTTEPEALNLIAQKADGGMRDALSIFDQMVSFTGGKITYDAVCQNLNVLSTEVYFSMTQHLLNKDLKQCMLLFNTILQRGFDGGIFIAGMASHLRDLLMAQDAQTISLLEQSEQTKQQYAAQAQACQPRFLYRAIKLCNDCSLAYRTSRNKRLQVEICLIQMEQLVEEDSPGSGPGPAQTIQPIQAIRHTQAAPTPVAAAPGATSAAIPATAAPIPSTQPAAPKAKLVRGFGPSIRKVAEVEEPADKVAEAEVAPYNPPAEQQPLQPDQLRVAWFEYITTLPRESVALAQRMRDMKPTIADAHTIALEVNNEQVAQMMRQVSTSLVPFLKDRLCNQSLTFHITICEVRQSVKRYNKHELFAEMKTANSALRELAEALDLCVE